MGPFGDNQSKEWNSNCVFFLKGTIVSWQCRICFNSSLYWWNQVSSVTTNKRTKSTALCIKTMIFQQNKDINTVTNSVWYRWRNNRCSLYNYLIENIKNNFSPVNFYSVHMQTYECVMYTMPFYRPHPKSVGYLPDSTSRNI